jgi:hypothetical protein
MARIQWTQDERALVVNTLASYLKSNSQTLDHIKRPGWLNFYLQQAQQFLPQERKRRITALTAIPWFLPALRVTMGCGAPSEECVQTVQDIPAFVRANMAAILAELSKTHVVVEKTACVQRQIHKPKEDPKDRELKVLVAGVLPAQAANLSFLYGNKMDLRFWYSSESASSGGTLPDVDYVVGVTSFISHSLDGKLRKCFKSRYQRIIGAITSVNKTLDDLLLYGIGKESKESKERVAA